MKSKRSRLLIMAIADKLNEKEMEIVKVKDKKCFGLICDKNPGLGLESSDRIEKKWAKNQG